ncbi:MAG: hypothetical protein GY862_05520 [Gammaproteobacteria bacterium]|nr:hypothetical protein [Gammaproteobacteria bacterium]
MSTPISIFIGSEKSLDHIALEIEKALSLEGEVISDNEHIYEYRGLGLTLTLFSDHGLDDDKGIPFSHYQYEMDLDVVRKDIEPEIWENLQYYTAMYIYQRIINELKCPTIVVDNLQKMI